MIPLEPLHLRQLTPDNHDRNASGMRYVYPVLSRRAQGVSIGINLNPNNACNWHCVYCQVEGLVRGRAPEIDLALLKSELLELTESLATGQFLEDRVPEGMREVRDFAFSGNGESTSSPQFAEALEVVAEVRDLKPEWANLPIVLITNGSLTDRPPVLDTIRRLGALGGRVWFKLDAATDAGLYQTNGARTHIARHVARLEKVAALCPTWIQSCWFRRQGEAPSLEAVTAYVTLLESLKRRKVPLEGIQLYTLARHPRQAEAETLAPLDAEWLEQLANQLRQLGFTVSVNI